MPEGLLAGRSDAELRDLFAYRLAMRCTSKEAARSMLHEN
jgi:hypothetical protein